MNMQAQKPFSETYVLGQTDQSIQRLLMQSQMLNPFTRRMLTDAGLSAGMNVLDIGCGPGDVSLIAADLVGETGSVLGVDMNAGVLQLAQARAQAAGLKNVSFQAGDVHELAQGQEFDAIIGRLILQHLPDRVAVLRQLTSRVRPGGLLAFQEYDCTTPADSPLPSSPLWERAWSWFLQPFQRAGVEPQMGMKLYSTFLDADLPAPQLRYEAAIGAGPDWIGYTILTETVRALLPLILKFGIATAEEIEIDTLEDRLRQESLSLRMVSRSPALVSAWVRKQ